MVFAAWLCSWRVSTFSSENTSFPAKKTVRRNGKLLELTRREFMLLEYLVLRRGELVSRAEIESRLYDDSSEPMSNVVDAAVHRLRKKIEVGGHAALIRTQRGLGYMLEARS